MLPAAAIATWCASGHHDKSAPRPCPLLQSSNRRADLLKEMGWQKRALSNAEHAHRGALHAMQSRPENVVTSKPGLHMPHANLINSDGASHWAELGCLPQYHLDLEPTLYKVPPSERRHWWPHHSSGTSSSPSSICKTSDSTRQQVDVPLGMK
jgi:hypothetical protein